MQKKFLLSAFCFALTFCTITDNAYSKNQILLPEIEPGEDGMYHQPWFFDSFLNLSEDILESTKSKKRLVIIFEQRGCPYCKEMHYVNLRRPKIVAYIKKHFNVIRMDLWGSREVTDFDGTKLAEKKFARKYGIQFTPTMLFFPESPTGLKDKHPRDRDVFRIFGYWKPFHFLNTFVYIKTNGYKSQPNFQRWLAAHAEELRAAGQEVKIWE